MGAMHQRRYDHYEQCLELLEQHLPDSRLLDQLRAEIEQLPDAIAHHALLAGAAD